MEIKEAIEILGDELGAEEFYADPENGHDKEMQIRSASIAEALRIALAALRSTQETSVAPKHNLCRCGRCPPESCGSDPDPII